MTWESTEEKKFKGRRSRASPNRLETATHRKRDGNQRIRCLSGTVKARGLVGNPNDIEGTPRALFVSTFELMRLLTLETSDVVRNRTLGSYLLRGLRDG